MDLEFVRNERRPDARPTISALALAAVAMFGGCSHLSGSRKAPPPMLGTSVDEGEGDPYLAHHAPRPRPEAPVEALAAARTRSTAHPLDAVSVADIETGTPVRLSAPETLATPSNPNPLRIATDVPDLATSKPTDPSVALAPKIDAPAGPTAASVVRGSREALDRLATYQVSMRRQERVNGELQPEEDVVLSVRRNPKAVRLEWPSGKSKGREVIFSASENGGLMHINMANAVVPLPRLSMPPDSPLVLQNSRHPITEAGFDNIVAGLETSLKPAAGQNPVAYAGVETPQEVGRPCDMLTRTGPKGERWTVAIDRSTHLPALVKELDAQGRLMERYVFRDVKGDLPDLAAPGAFDVDKRWGSGGFLSRLARAGADAANSSRQ